ncbi:hypothetical protein BH20ACT6_BH20ACT6_19050 [soil metagenome]
MAESSAPSSTTAIDRRGELHIAGKAIERLATLAAQRVSGVTRTGSGLDKMVGRSYPRADSTVAGNTVRLSVDVAVLWPHGAGEVARAVRAEVTREVGNLTGLSVASVDVTVARFEQPTDQTAAATPRRRVE